MAAHFFDRRLLSRLFPDKIPDIPSYRKIWHKNCFKLIASSPSHGSFQILAKKGKRKAKKEDS
jgi:hypothetical protein